MELTFNPSKAFTIGIELELQIINPADYDLAARARELLREIRCFQKKNLYAWKLNPEVSDSMIEVNSSIHENIITLLSELNEIRNFLIEKAEDLQIAFAGGGTHPFQRWINREIFPTPRFKHLNQKYGFLAKRFTVFGQHIHIGCTNTDDLLYLTHALARYVPHFIALSASSPFYQGIDSTFDSARVSIVNAFPLSGTIPYVKSWDEFSAYYHKMLNLKIINSMKDFYWDVRPKPEFGTVELRICDTPLTMQKAAEIAAYAQTLAHYLLSERSVTITPDFYLTYSYNRFQASRYAFEGKIVDTTVGKSFSIAKDILKTIKRIKPYAEALHNQAFIAQLEDAVTKHCNDAKWLRRIYAKTNSFQALVKHQCQML